MKLISIGKIDRKFILFLFIYLFLDIIILTIDLLLKDKDIIKEENLFLKNIIYYSCYLFYLVPEFIIKKISTTRRNKEEEKLLKKNSTDKIVYIYTDSAKTMSYKNFLYLFLIEFINYIFIIGMGVCPILYNDFFKLCSNEFQSVMYMFYFHLIFRIAHKMIFYKHQYLSFLIIFFIDFIRCLFVIIIINRDNYDFPHDLISISALLVLAAIGSFEYYIMKKYMQYKYLSPFLAIFMKGLVFAIISIIALPIFLNMDCKEKFKPIICEIRIKNAEILDIILYVFKAIISSFVAFLKFKTMDDFTMFHILIYSSFDTFLNDIIDLCINFAIDKIILSIITFAIKIVFISVFLELIELNFYGLNFNLKKNIIKRSQIELNSLYQNFSTDEDSNAGRISENSTHSTHSNKDEDNNQIY